MAFDISLIIYSLFVEVEVLGNICIADTGKKIIRMISKTSGFIHTVAGTPGVADCGGDDILPTFDKLSEPVGLVVDTAGNIYIADTDSSLIRMIIGNGYNFTVAGSPELPDFSDDGRSVTSD